MPLIGLDFVYQVLFLLFALIDFMFENFNVKLARYFLLDLVDLIDLPVLYAYHLLQLVIFLVQVFESLLLQSEIVLFLVLYYQKILELGFFLFLSSHYLLLGQEFRVACNWNVFRMKTLLGGIQSQCRVMECG